MKKTCIAVVGCGRIATNGHFPAFKALADKVRVKYACDLIEEKAQAKKAEYPELVAGVCCEDYYVRMAVSWYFATALAKQFDCVISYLTEHRLEKWIHNKTIQKAIESYRINPEQKAYLKTLRIK